MQSEDRTSGEVDGSPMSVSVELSTSKDANSNCIDWDWGTVFLAHLKKSKMEFNELLNSVGNNDSEKIEEIRELYSPSSMSTFEDEPFGVPNLDDFFAYSGPPINAELPPIVNPGYDLDNVNNGIEGKKDGMINMKNGTCLLVRSSSCPCQDNMSIYQILGRPGCNKGCKSRRQKVKKEANVPTTLIPQLPNCTIIKNMMKWYIRSSVSDLMWMISRSSEKEFPLLLLPLFDLPIEENEWCWSFISEQIYLKIMNSALVTVGQQVAFWQALHNQAWEGLNEQKIVQRLFSRLKSDIALIFKCKPNQLLLLHHFQLGEECDPKSKMMLDFFFPTVFKFSRFLHGMLDKELIASSNLVENLVVAAERLTDIKCLTLFLSTINQISNDVYSSIFSPFNLMYSTPDDLNDSQLGFFQIYAKLKAFVNDYSHITPPSIITFCRGILFCRIEAIHLQWTQLGVLEFRDITARVRPRRKIDAEEERRREQLRPNGERMFRPIEPIERLLQTDLINEFYSSIIEKYKSKLRANDADERESKTSL